MSQHHLGSLLKIRMPGPTLETKSEYPGHDVRRHVYIFNIYQLILTFFPQPHLLPELKTKKLRDNRGSQIWSSVFPHPVSPGAALNTPVSSGPSSSMETSGFYVPHFRGIRPTLARVSITAGILPSQLHSLRPAGFASACFSVTSQNVYKTLSFQTL